MAHIVNIAPDKVYFDGLRCAHIGDWALEPRQPCPGEYREAIEDVANYSDGSRRLYRPAPPEASGTSAVEAVGLGLEQSDKNTDVISIQSPPADGLGPDVPSAPERAAEEPSPIPPPEPDAVLSDFGAVGDLPDGLSAMPDTEADDMEAARLLQALEDGLSIDDEIGLFSSDKRDRLTQRLHRMKGQVRRERKLSTVTDRREESIDQMIGLLAKRGV